MSKEKTGYPSIDRTHLKGVPKSKLNPLILPFNLLGLFIFMNWRRMSEAIVEEGEKTYSGRELKNDSIAFAKTLKIFGFEAGDEIGIALPNCYEGVVITFAANLLGIKVFYFNEGILDIELKRAPVKCLFVAKRQTEELRKLQTENEVMTVVVEKENVPEREEEAYFYFDDLMKIGKEAKVSIFKECIKNGFNKKDLIYIQTSGSTSGLPKILPFSNRKVSAFLSIVRASTGAKPNEEDVKRVLVIIPYRISYGWTLTFANICIGNCVRFAEGSTPEAIGAYYKCKPTYVYGTPLIFRVFMERTPKTADLSFLKRFYVAGFSISEETMNKGVKYLAAHKCTGQICNNYGIGEALCVGTTSDNIEHKPGYSGKFYFVDWLIGNRKEDGRIEEVKYGKMGEIFVSSPTLCNGYYGDEEATKNAFVTINGKEYFVTGDYGLLEESGYVKIVGRKKRFYQPLGANDKVNCETIEKALLKIDKVKECAVVVYSPNGKYETSCAFVVLESGAKDEKTMKVEIWNSLKDQLQPFQLPSSIKFMDSLPRLEATKINYQKLEKMCE